MALVGFCEKKSWAEERPRGVRKYSSAGTAMIPASTPTMYRTYPGP